MKSAKGFTLVEIIVVVIILGIMAAVAIPKFSTSNERVISSEARQTLTSLLGAQKRYYLDNSAYTAAIANLDVDATGSTNFNDPAALNPGAAGNVASISRKGGVYTYTLCIDHTGKIGCQGASCATAGCTGAAAAYQCNSAAAVLCN